MPLDPIALGDPHVPAHNAERAAINALEAEVDTKISLPPGAATGDLLRWDGTAWMTTDTRFFEGNGNPNGVVAAPVGSRYVDKTAALGIVEWVKSFGGESNQGWISMAGDTGWLEVGATGNAAFLNGWTNYGGWTTAAYRLKNGVVYLKGLVTRPTTRAFAIFNLPAGFRPSGETHNPAWSSGGVPTDGMAVNISRTSGAVTGRPTSAGLVSLDGIVFPADY